MDNLTLDLESLTVDTFVTSDDDILTGLDTTASDNSDCACC